MARMHWSWTELLATPEDVVDRVIEMLAGDDDTADPEEDE